jgi:phosphoribosylanthranilate isomerase
MAIAPVGAVGHQIDRPSVRLGMSTAVKICGITRVEDALYAARAGAHALGFVFHPPSPRFLEAGTAARIAHALPPFITAVGLFVDAPAATVREVLARVPLQLLQFHGAETAEYCAGFGIPYMKAVRVEPKTDLLQYARDFSGAQALLLDAFVPGIAGGTGTTFDWSLIPATLPLPVVLSGGLNAENVVAAIRQVRPYAVDVSSGVEAAKGIKDPLRIASFMERVRHADL